MNKETDIIWLVNAYGHLIPWNQVINGVEFADKIKETYRLENSRNRFAFELAQKSNCRFKSNYNGVGYCLQKEG